MKLQTCQKNECLTARINPIANHDSSEQMNISAQQEIKINRYKHLQLIPCASMDKQTAGHTSIWLRKQPMQRKLPSSFSRRGATTESKRVCKTRIAPKSCELVHREIGRTNRPSTFERHLIAPFVVDQGLSIDVPLDPGSSRWLGSRFIEINLLPLYFHITVRAGLLTGV